MTQKTILLAALAFVLLLQTGCHTIDRYQWVGPATLQGKGGAMKLEGQIEFWVEGEPDKPYEPLQIVETTTTGYIGVQSYLFGVLRREAEKINANGVIILNRQSQNGGYVTTGSANTTTYGSLYGNSYSGTSTTFGTAVTAPVQYNTYRGLLFRYR